MSRQPRTYVLTAGLPDGDIPMLCTANRSRAEEMAAVVARCGRLTPEYREALGKAGRLTQADILSLELWEFVGEKLVEHTVLELLGGVD